jgi:hypothetical protein
MARQPTGTDYMGRTFSEFVDSLDPALDSPYQFQLGSPNEFAEFLARPTYEHTYIDIQTEESNDTFENKSLTENDLSGDKSYIDLTNDNDSLNNLSNGNDLPLDNEFQEDCGRSGQDAGSTEDTD